MSLKKHGYPQLNSLLGLDVYEVESDNLEFFISQSARLGRRVKKHTSAFWYLLEKEVSQDRMKWVKK